MSRTRFSSLALILCCLLATTASAVQPTLSAISPYGFQRGTEVEASFTGARLGDAEELMFYSPGIKVLELDAAADNKVVAKLAIEPECRLGIHAVRVRTATGVSGLRTFTIGAMAQLDEKEPNNEFTEPQPIEMNRTVSGIVQSEDVDHFVVEAKKGERITAELEGIRLGYTFFDPYLAILNDKRFELARSDDASLLRQDCLCSVIAPEDGKYIVQVRESAYGGNGACRYRLHVGKFPRPRAVVPAGGKPGETITLRWIGDAAGEWTEQITLPDEENLEYDLFAKDDHGISPSPNVIRVTDLENSIEVEPNEAAAQATPASAPGALNGVIGVPGDVDWFKFEAKKGQTFDVRVYARNGLRSPLDSVLVVRRANGSAVGSNDDSGGPDSYYRFRAPADEEYFVQIYDHLRSGGPTFAYRIEIAPVKPALTMVLPERVRYQSQTLTVPRGNRMALMVNATRANLAGEIDVKVDGMPEGMDLQTITMPANRSTIPLLFSAAADAPVAGALADLVGVPLDERYEGVVGHLSQRTMLVRGQNNRDVWGHDADRMAISLADEAPFEIEIVQPKSPIARRGSKSLKVIAKRKEGFNQAISIRMLYNPPGIGSSGSISIPGDKNEAAIPLTANTSAAIGKWPIVVTGSAPHAGGRVETATQMAELEISDSYLGLAFNKAAAELGQDTEMVVNVENKIEYDGEATIQLLGLPANTTTPSEPKKITKTTEQVVFPVAVTEKARPGTYKSLVCRVIVTQNGEPVTHTIGTGELRIDKPLPPKVDEPKPKPAATAAKPKPAPAKKPAKRLSRLEQLRLEREKAKAAQE